MNDDQAKVYVGRIGVNQQGRLGVALKWGRHREHGTVAYFGVGADGKYWYGKIVTFLTEEEGERVHPMFLPPERKDDVKIEELLGQIGLAQTDLGKNLSGLWSALKKITED